jgi:hypothetical protein
MSTVRIQLRRGTATEWTNADTDLNASGGLVLAAGEMAVETNTRKIKIGDGTSRWSELSYVASDSPAITEIAQDAIDQALSMGSGLEKSYNDNTNTISITIDDTVVALKSYVDSEVVSLESYVDSQVGGLENAVTSDYVLLADVGNAGGPAKLDVDGNLLVPKSSIVLEGATDNDFETILTVVDPTEDRTITFPNATGTVAFTSDITTAVSTASADATSKANAAQSAAEATASADATSKANAAQSAAEATASSDATTKADAAQAAAEATAAADATSKANAAQSAAVSTASADATSKANAAQSAAEATASADATTKADAAQAAAISTAAADATTKADAAQAAAEATAAAALSNLVDAAPGALDTLNELAAAIGDDANYAAGVTSALGTLTTGLGNLSAAGVSHGSSTTNVHGIADTAELATESYVDAAEADANTYADSAIGTAMTNHSNDSTDVHGIVDTADLMLKSGSSMTGDLTLNGAPTFDLQASTKKYVDDTKNTHAAVTTSVHGIADTAELATKSYADTAEADAITAAGTAADTKISTAVAALTKSSVGLANVDDTADADKPVSTATQTALDGKASLSGATFTGSVEIDQNLVVDGDLTVNGTSFNASSTSIVIEDNILQLAHQNAANTVDLGIVVGYNDGEAKHSGLVRDVSDAKWKLFKGVTTEPATTVDFSEGSLDDLSVNNLTAAGIVFSDGTQTKIGVPSITTFGTEVTSSATLAAGEEDKFVPLNGEVEITLPSSGYATGQSIDFYQSSGTGASFASTNSVVGTPGLKFRTTNSVVTAMKTPSGWLVFGDLKA